LNNVNIIDVLFHAGDLAGIAIIIAVLWTKLGSIEKAFDGHVAEDVTKFRLEETRRHELRNETGAITNRIVADLGELAQRVATLEGQSERRGS